MYQDISESWTTVLEQNHSLPHFFLYAQVGLPVNMKLDSLSWHLPEKKKDHAYHHHFCNTLEDFVGSIHVTSTMFLIKWDVPELFCLSLFFSQFKIQIYVNSAQVISMFLHFYLPREWERSGETFLPSVFKTMIKVIHSALK